MSEWKLWRGGICPVEPHTTVEVRLRGPRRRRVVDQTHRGMAKSFDRVFKGNDIGWENVGDRWDIIAYRIGDAT